MKQFTVYAKSEKDGKCNAVYMVNFVNDSAICYPLQPGWNDVSEKVESGINKLHFGENNVNSLWAWPKRQ